MKLSLRLIPLLLLLPWSGIVLGDEDQKIYDLNDFTLESGATLPAAKLSYTVHGSMNTEGNNAILVPSFYLGDHHGYDFLIGPGKALDPENTSSSPPTCFKTDSLAPPVTRPRLLTGQIFPKFPSGITLTPSYNCSPPSWESLTSAQ
jgi:hypothetical protein